MLDFLEQNAATILIVLIIATALAGAIRKMIRDRQKGKACGSCSGCSQAGACASRTRKNNDGC
jgi:hypothetical protein